MKNKKEEEKIHTTTHPNFLCISSLFSYSLTFSCTFSQSYKKYISYISVITKLHETNEKYYCIFFNNIIAYLLKEL